jgi:hypothetical protein
MIKLKVHENKRYLMTDDGKPFFYLGDTAWELFHRLHKNEIDYYMQLRAKQEFNVVQAVALSEFDGLTTPNVHGRLPLKNDENGYNPTLPDTDGDYSYWDHVDYAVKSAEKHNIFIALLPTWGDKFNKKWGKGPEIFNENNAFEYGKWIGDRYKNNWNIIWMLGGDRPLETETHHIIIDSMARGIKTGDSGSHLMTFHPTGAATSADHVFNRDYIDFHTVQSGHGLETYDSWKLLRRTGEKELKPFMDSEPRYEDHPCCFKAEYGYLWDADDVRQTAYWDLMEGVCGHTYGNHSVWSMNTTPHDYIPFRWQEVMEHQGAALIKHMKNLRLTRPYFEFRNAPELVCDDTAVMAHQSGGRGDNYGFVYSPLGQPIRANLGIFDGSVIKASWYNPRSGEITQFAVVPAKTALFVPPSQGKGSDWVLVVDVIG